MADEAKTESPKAATKAAEKTEAEVQKTVDKETDKGFRGTEVDKTPNENYTVKGAAAGKPVPEAAADPVQARKDASA